MRTKISEVFTGKQVLLLTCLILESPHLFTDLPNPQRNLIAEFRAERGLSAGTRYPFILVQWPHD